MKLVKLTDVLETLEKLKDNYNQLRLLIADQVRDDQIPEAENSFEKLMKLKTAIEQMENLNVQIES